MSDNRYTVYRIAANRVWTIENKYFGEEAARTGYATLKARVEREKKGGARLESPAGALLLQFIFGDDPQTAEQPTLF